MDRELSVAGIHWVGPDFCSGPSMIFTLKRLRRDVEEQAHGAGDDRGGEEPGRGVKAEDEDVVRETGEAQTVYAWKSKRGGTGASDEQEAKRLREGNSRLRGYSRTENVRLRRGGSKTLRIPGVSLRLLLWLFRAH